jgi:hypothetical protein
VLTNNSNNNTSALSPAAAAAAAAAVFTVQDHARLPKEGAADLLQLALNCKHQATATTVICHLPIPAASAARRMPQLLEPDVARKLLVTAATRRHVTAVHKMITYQQLGYMKQHIDAATLQVLLMLFEMPDAYLESLVQLPAAANLSSEYVIRLLLAASDARYRRTGFSAVRVVCQLPAAQQLDRAAVLQLLQAAIQQGCVPWHLCELPAAVQLSSGEVLQLLQAAVQLGMDNTNELCNLPGAQQLESAAVLQLLQAAVQNIQTISGFCELPGAQQLDYQAVLQLLQTAVQHVDKDLRVDQMTLHLCRLPAAQQLSSQAVLQLLQAAVVRGKISMSSLCALPTASQIDSMTVLQLLQAAVQQGRSGDGLCTLPAAQQLTKNVVFQLLEMAVQRGNDDGVKSLSTLPAAKQLRETAVAALLQTSKQVGSAAASGLGAWRHSSCLAALFKLRAAICRLQLQQDHVG